MKRGNKVRYKKHLQFIDIENEGGIEMPVEMPEGGHPNNNVQKNETIVSYNKDIGIVNYHDKIVFHRAAFNEMTPMNVRHIKWALGRAKNRTKDNTWTTLQG
jgi:hypothetical protein